MEIWRKGVSIDSYIDSLTSFWSRPAPKSRGRAPGQASDYALRVPNPLDSSAMTRCFIKISGPPKPVRAPGILPPCPPTPPPLAGLDFGSINVKNPYLLAI